MHGAAHAAHAWLSTTCAAEQQLSCKCRHGLHLERPAESLCCMQQSNQHTLLSTLTFSTLIRVPLSGPATKHMLCCTAAWPGMLLAAVCCWFSMYCFSTHAALSSSAHLDWCSRGSEASSWIVTVTILPLAGDISSPAADSIDSMSSCRRPVPP
jgi:hypothetical protein